MSAANYPSTSSSSTPIPGFSIHAGSPSTSKPGPSNSHGKASSSTATLTLTPHSIVRNVNHPDPVPGQSGMPGPVHPKAGAKVFREGFIEPGHSYSALAFSDNGETLVTSSDDDDLHIYNCKTGMHSRVIHSKKYGANLSRFAHHRNNLIFASTKPGDDAIRYYSMHDSKFLSYFRGHKQRVTTLEMSPGDDTFLSGSTDDTVRLWDLRSPNPQGLLRVAGRPSVAYDPSGLIFAVTLNLKSTTLLYDIRKLDVEPFAQIEIKDPSLSAQSWPPVVPVATNVRFSNDGTFLLVTTAVGKRYVLHSFDYKVHARLEGPQPLTMEGDSVNLSGEETTWTPDGRFALCGSGDGNIYVYDVNPPPAELAKMTDRMPPGEDCVLQPIKILQGHKHTASRVVRFNPKYAMFVSGGTDELAFWLNDPAKEDGKEA